MVKENEGVTDDQAAEGQGVTGQPATDQVVKDQPDTGADDVKQDENRIPLSRLNEEIEKKKTAERDAQLMRDQMAVLQANQAPPPEQPKDIYEQLGIQSWESPTVEQQRQIDAYKAQQGQQTANQMFNQQFINSHPDYAEVVGVQVSPTQFQKSAELQNILTQKPHLAASAYSSAQAAYQIVMEERKLTEMVKEKTSLEEHQAQQDVDNKTNPMSSSAAGGGGTPDNMAAGLNTIDDVSAMEARVAAGEFDEKG